MSPGSSSDHGVRHVSACSARELLLKQMCATSANVWISTAVGGGRSRDPDIYTKKNYKEKKICQLG